MLAATAILDRTAPRPTVNRVAARSTLATSRDQEIRLSTGEETELLRQALTGGRHQLNALVSFLMPVVQLRISRVLSTAAGASRRRNLREEVEDMSQEVFATLFDNDAKVLRAWSPDRGLSLRNFVGMVARRKAHAILSVRKRNPWYEEPIEDSVVERALPEAADAEGSLAAKQIIATAMARLEAEQSERGKHIAGLIFKDGLDNAEVVAATGLKTDAVYQWRSRLTRALRKHIDTLMAEEGSR